MTQSKLAKRQKQMETKSSHTNSNNSVTDCCKVKVPMTSDISITGGGTSRLFELNLFAMTTTKKNKETIFCSCVTQMFMNSDVISTMPKKEPKTKTKQKNHFNHKKSNMLFIIVLLTD